jgi:hypothetical protein
MRTYTSNEVCAILETRHTCLGKLAENKPGFKIATNTWNADLIDEEKKERDYRKQIYKKPLHGGDSYA